MIQIAEENRRLRVCQRAKRLAEEELAYFLLIFFIPPPRRVR